MEEYLKNLIDNFGEKDYKTFVGYVYYSLQREIDSVRTKRDKDKYIKIRKNILSYIVSNERVITSELRKKKATK